MHVIVTFHIEADDPDHHMGLSNETFEKIEEAVGNVGGYDTDYEKVEDSDD